MNTPFLNRCSRSHGVESPRTAPRHGRARGPARLCLGLLLALLPLQALALDPDEKLRDYILTRWDAEDGLPQSLVRQIIQTRDGYLWVGTSQGVARFDGLTFTTFKQPTTAGFPGNAITNLAETSDGSLWIGTSSGLGRYRDGRFTTYTTKDGLKSATINTLCLAADGSLWIGSREGITRWVDGKFVQDIDTSAYDTSGMQAITADRQGGMWLTTGIAALRYADGKFTRFGSEHGLPATSIRSIREDADGRFLAVTQNGLFRMEHGRFAPFQPGPVSPRQNSTLVDRAGILWIASIGGLERFAKGKIELYVDPHGENPGAVDTIFEDREGSLWFGGYVGLARLTNRRGYSLSTEEGVLGAAGLAVRESRDGSVWLSSWAGGVARFQNGSVRQYRAGAPLSHETVTCIYEAPDGTMWFGNRGSSVDRLEGDTVTTFVYALGVPTSRFVSAMYETPEGEFLVAIAGRGLLALRNGQLAPVPEAPVFASGIIWVIHRTRDGRLLVAGTRGLFERGADRSFRPVAVPGVTGVISIRSLMEEEDGTIWLATEGRGLIHWKSGETRSYGEREGLIGDSVSSIIDDRAGSLWVTTTRGIVRIPRTELAQFDGGKIARLNLTTFGRADGLKNTSISTGAAPLGTRLADGRLMFATGKGFAVIDPGRLQVNTQPPNVVIEAVIADDQPLALAPGQAIAAPPGTNRLEIRYTALSLIAPHRLRFRYQLEGSDTGWIEAGHERTAHYTHLSPGAYTFRVLASNSDGVWTETGASLAIVLLPLFYQTVWFRSAAVLLVVAALAFAVGFRIHQINRRQLTLARANAELDQRVRERTNELARERARFKFIFDSVPVGFTWMVQHQLATRMVNPAQARITGVPAERCRELELYRLATHPDDRARQDALHQQLQAGEIDHYNLEKRYVHGDGSVRWTLFSLHLHRDATGEDVQEICTLVDITERIRIEAQLEQTHKQLMETSRQAGMAEVATSVLHNVGNTLNSVNISATLVAELVAKSRLSSLAKVCGLLREHAADLGAFLHDDPKGRHLPAFLEALAGHLATEHATMLQELHSLRKNVDHIKDIIARQQNYARISGVVETVALSDLAEEALRMNASALAQHDITLVRDYQAQIKVVVEPHKVLQILVNLIRNAWFACGESSRPGRQITVRLTGDGRRARIAISDNGIGIPADNLARIFNHGFTTKKEGHGFGLHSCALAAKELGGALTVQSDGPGLGAMFILELPMGAPPPAAGNPPP